AELIPQIAAYAKIAGERGARYGEFLCVEASVLIDLDRPAEAAQMLARASEIIAFANGDDASTHAECDLSHATPLPRLRHHTAALAMFDRVVAVLVKAHGASHPEVAGALTKRGAAHAALGHHKAALADFEQAISILAPAQLEPGYLASARWGLGKELWPS